VTPFFERLWPGRPASNVGGDPLTAEFSAGRWHIGGMVTDRKPRRHPNRAQKHALKVAELARHVRAVGRKAQKRTEPNDRKDDPAFKKKLRSIQPEQLDRLLRDDEEE
jgi:hypothetical protein